jgi:hypothetical protein
MNSKLDWKNIENGTKIKVLGRSGTYYLGNNGDKTYMSDPGVYTVIGKDSNGLRVHG